MKTPILLTMKEILHEQYEKISSANNFHAKCVKNRLQNLHYVFKRAQMQIAFNEQKTKIEFYWRHLLHLLMINEICAQYEKISSVNRCAAVWIAQNLRKS